MFYRIPRTSLAMLKDFVSDKIQKEEDLDNLKKNGEINARQHFMLTGFLYHLNSVTSVPSEGDKKMISKAYYSRSKIAIAGKHT